MHQKNRDDAEMEVRPASPSAFDPEFYVRQYPEVLAAGFDPLDHYLRFGQAEGRLPHAHERFDGCVDVWKEGVVAGWAVDALRPGKPAQVAILSGNSVVTVLSADSSRPDVAALKGVEGPCGFTYEIKSAGLRLSPSLRVLVVGDEAASTLRQRCRDRDLSPFHPEVRFDAALRDLRPEPLELPVPRQNVSLPPELASGDAGTGVCLLEIQDLVNYLAVHSSVTGIQRTVCGIIKSLLEKPNSSYGLFAFCAVSEFPGYVGIVDKEKLLSLVDGVLKHTLTDAERIDLVSSLTVTSARYFVQASDRFVITGAYWIVSDYGQRLFNIKKSGALVGTYIYDIIPITNPQWVTTSTNRAVLDSAFDVFAISDFFLTISEFVKRDMARLLELEFGATKPITAVPLPHQAGFVQKARSVTPHHHAASPYVLCVCTLEGRKNHALLHRIWAALLRKYGFEAVPKLVLVGRWGWRIEEFRELCESTNYLDGKIAVRTEVDDRELEKLYNGCMFTIFPSFVEGWGLPVGESLAFGKFCIASRTSSIPEVGGDFVDYIDPYDYFESLKVVERAIFDPAYLRARTSRIVEEFVPRTWADLTERFMSTIRGCLTPSEPTTYPQLKDGMVVSFAGLKESLIVSWSEKKARFVLASNWHPLENWGAWSAEPCAQILFTSPFSQGAQLVVWLELRLPNSYGGEAVIIESSGAPTVDLTEKGLNELPKWVKLPASVGKGGIVSLYLRRPAAFAREEAGRRLFIGVSGLAFHLLGDDEAALRIAGDLIRPIDSMFPNEQL